MIEEGGREFDILQQLHSGRLSCHWGRQGPLARGCQVLGYLRGKHRLHRIVWPQMSVILSDGESDGLP